MAKVKIEIEVDADGAVKSTKILGDTMDQTGKKSHSFGQAIQVALGVIAANAVTYLTNTLRGLVTKGLNLLGDSLTSAKMQVLTEKRLEQALRLAGDESEESARKLKLAAIELQRVSNFGDETVMTAQAMLLAFKDAGGAEGVEFLTSRLADMSAGLSKSSGGVVSMEDTVKVLGRALSGEADGLSRYGIVLSDVEKNAIKAANGIDRVKLIGELIDSRFKGMAQTTADPFIQLKNAAGDLEEEFGLGLLPLADDVAKRLAQLAQDPEVAAFVRKLGQDVADMIRGGIDLIVSIIGWWRTHDDQIRTSARVVGYITTLVLAYVSGTKAAVAAQFVWTSAVAAHTLVTRGAAAAQLFLTNAVKKNPIGFVLTLVTAAIIAFMEFKEQIYSGAAAVLEFAANVSRAIPWMGESTKLLDTMAKGARAAAEEVKQERLAEEERNKALEEQIETGQAAADVAQANINLMGKYAKASGDLTKQQEIEKQSTELLKSAAADLFNLRNSELDQYQKRITLLRARAEQDSKNAVALRALADELERERNAMKKTEAEEKLIEARKKLQMVLDETKNKHQSEIDSLETLKLKYPEMAGEIDALIVKYRDLGREKTDIEKIENAEKKGRELLSITSKDLGVSIKQIDESMQLLQTAYSLTTSETQRSDIQALIDKLALLKGQLEVIKTSSLEIGPVIQQSLSDTFKGVAEAIGNTIAAAQEGGDVGQVLLMQLAELGERVGAMMISFGVAGLALKNLVINPIGAIVAGIALVALSRAARSRIQAEIDSQKNRAPAGGSSNIPRKAGGGLFRGRGGPREDANLVRISDGEFVVNAAATRRNIPVLDAINRGAPVIPISQAGSFAGLGSSGINSHSIDRFDRAISRLEKIQWVQDGMKLRSVIESVNDVDSAVGSRGNG